MIQVQAFTFNEFSENTYLLYDESGECIIIDPGCNTSNEKKILTGYIEKNNLKPVMLINTHCHIDHVLGVQFVKDTYQLRFGIHELEIPLLEAVSNYSHLWGINYSPASHDYLIDVKDILQFGKDSTLRILHCPGHSPGSVCFYSESDHFIISGDVLFRESIGRTDLPGGSTQTLLDSIEKQMYALPDETIVYSGHGTPTTITHEKKYNPFVNANS